MSNFFVDTRSLMRMERVLSSINDRALPFATNRTINSAARETQVVARELVRSNMTLKNSFTVRSIRFTPSRGLNINTQESIVGSTAKYMAAQEFGGTKTSAGSEGVPIPTAYSAGQAGNRTRLPRAANKLRQINLSRRNTGGGRRARNTRKIAMAARGGGARRYAFLDFGRKKGIFKIVGSRTPALANLKMVYDMSKRSVDIPRNPWLEPAKIEASRKIPLFYRDAMRFQINRMMF